MTPDCLPGGAGEADVDEAGVELQLGEHRAQVRLVVLPGKGGQPAGGQVHDAFSSCSKIAKRFLRRCHVCPS